MENATQVHEPEPRDGFLGWLRHAVPALLVLLALAGVAYWGHHTNWTFHSAPPAAPAPPAPEGLARVRLGAPVPDVPDGSPLRREVVIEFDTEEAVEQVGIDVTPAWPGPIRDEVVAPGEISFDPARVARLAARAPGFVRRVMKAPGQSVAKGEVLALIDAADAGKAKSEFQQALVQLRLREKTLAARREAGKGVSTQAVREAEAAVAVAETQLLSAAQSLANFDLDIDVPQYRALPLETVVERMRLLGVPADTPGLDPKTATANLIPVRSPFDGVVLSSDAVTGETAELGRTLFVVADARAVWVTLHVSPTAATRVKLGQPLHFRTDGSDDETTGAVEWIGPAAAEGTRTVPIRASLANPDGVLRAGTLGQGRIVQRDESRSLLVPHDAVQMFRGTPVVFVRDPAFLKPNGPKAFTARPVRVGARDATYVEIQSGLKAGDVVVMKGGTILLNELTRAVDGASPEQ